MKTTAIQVEGNILSPELFDRLIEKDFAGQLDSQFGTKNVKDDISLAWQQCKEDWERFAKLRESLLLKESEIGTTETRKNWLLPLFKRLGYDLEAKRSGELVNGKNYTISHADKKRDSFPVHTVSFKRSLDKREGEALSPHALMQEYLNATDHLYAIVSNGLQLRVLRDSVRMVRLSYLEFNLERMFEDDLFGEFAILYRLLHSTRMPEARDRADKSLFESYHQEALATGDRLRENLSIAVEEAIPQLGNSYLKHPANQELRDLVLSGKISGQEYFEMLLRVIYKVLFVFVIEERDIIYPDPENVADYKKSKTAKQRKIYYEYYSLSRLKLLAEKKHLVEPQAEDLAYAFAATLQLFENKTYGERLGIQQPGGELFAGRGTDLLSKCLLTNEELLQFIYTLNYYTDSKTKRTVKVNYAALNVEEFGSVYEGLLELEGNFITESGVPRFGFVQGSARSNTGTHYTPEELAQHLIKNSVDHVIEEKLKLKDPAKALLGIKVCDFASGSGHILLSVARRIALAHARAKYGEDQPAPSKYRASMREVISHCIYGVDINPLAAELCKVSLWLESYNPGKPLTFLDHRIRVGNSIVGIARKEEIEKGIPPEAFKVLPGDDKLVVGALKKKHTEELKGMFTLFDDVVEDKINKLSASVREVEELPDETLEEIEIKQTKYLSAQGEQWMQLKLLCDAIVAPFFMPKTLAGKENIPTQSDLAKIKRNDSSLSIKKKAAITAIAQEKKFFHWFLEFPEVFEQGGFDVVIGNPPFLGGQRLSGTFGKDFLEFVKEYYAPAGSVDMVVYFLRRGYTLLHDRAFISIISTNTLAQGGAREGGLDVLVNQGASINFAIRSMKWPGVAAVEVALVSLYKGKWNKKFRLGIKEVDTISTYLSDEVELGNPYQLKANENLSFQGSIVLGKGFVLEPEEAESLIKSNPKNKEVIFPYLNGDDLNSRWDQSPSRWVINFFDWTEEHCRTHYPEVFKIIEERVKPERMKLDENANSTNKKRKNFWWQYGADAKQLYRTIANMERVLVVARVGKPLYFSFSLNNKVFDEKLIIIAKSGEVECAILQSCFHQIWSWKYCTTMGTSTIQYTPTLAFNTFPFPVLTSSQYSKVETKAKEYFAIRNFVTCEYRINLTQVFNLINSSEPNTYLSKIKISNELHSLIIEYANKMKIIVREIDYLLTEYYGWWDIDLSHDFYVIDWFPENDNIRFTISPEARKEILKRLLLLNHARYAEEVRNGLHSKPTGSKSTKSGAKPNTNPTNQGELF